MNILNLIATAENLPFNKWIEMTVRLAIVGSNVFEIIVDTEPQQNNAIDKHKQIKTAKAAFHCLEIEHAKVLAKQITAGKQSDESDVCKCTSVKLDSPFTAWDNTDLWSQCWLAVARGT